MWLTKARFFEPAGTGSGRTQQQNGYAFFDSVMHLIMPSGGAPRKGILALHGANETLRQVAERAMVFRQLTPVLLDCMAASAALAGRWLARRQKGHDVADDTKRPVTIEYCTS